MTTGWSKPHYNTSVVSSVVVSCHTRPIRAHVRPCYLSYSAHGRRPSVHQPLSFTYDAREDEEIEGALVTIEHASGDRTELGCVTLTEMWQWLQSGPEGVPTDLLYPVDPATGAAITTASTVEELTGVWLVRTSLAVSNGVTMNLKGTSVGGDCDELKIRSSTTLIHAVRGHGGNLDIYKTLIQSWDENLLTAHILADDSTGDEPRSYIACTSEVVNENDTCDSGYAREDKGECRMDMVDSELGHMGYFASESYGITWKVRGFCEDMSNPEVFDNVNVYGDITNCDIHHMWYGMYSYGHQGGVWTDSLMHDNYVYGFDPHDDSDYLTIRNNTVWNNKNHGIIASKRCDHVVIQDNTVDTSGGSGIMLHRSCDDSEITELQVQRPDGRHESHEVSSVWPRDHRDYFHLLFLGLLLSSFQMPSCCGIIRTLVRGDPGVFRPGFVGMRGNVVSGNDGAGVSIVETSRVVISDNVFTDNKYGARLTVGSTDNQVVSQQARLTTGSRDIAW
ncbi:Mannuronan C-5-epimerase [Ectocarpus siliculosus]|uniref:Mannuronan C-5-epimerase n=1 Tax=Ectocarpus siliculosus TaxID=2880 RepID=D7FWW1_ECTSI|nr:Mannuronan C-5-epimerase [Ectocarpus siliculosus]|eukprot:CBJ32199.1 Mannuronan C-5-epimerase [Ectocarpus siliculosus]